MTSRDRKLLAILVAVAALAAAVVGGSLYLDSRKALHASLLSARKEVAALRLIAAELPTYAALADDMRRCLETDTAEAGNPDLFTLANRISKELAGKGLRIRHSAISGAGGLAVLEMDLEGDIRSIIAIMGSISKEPGYKLRSSRITRGESMDGAEAAFRIGYAAKK